MTETQQRVEIARWMGIKATVFRGCVVDAITLCDTVPDYLNDLNAIAEVTEKLTEFQRMAYVGRLVYSTKLDNYPVGFGDMFRLTEATAAVRNLTI